MWGRLHLINGYSPIRPAGVARAFGAQIHGEIDPGTADYLLGWQSGPEGLLAELGIDGILVAQEIALAPKPESEWDLVFSSTEGRVYHRRDAPFPRIRSRISIASRPNEQFAIASIRMIEDSRNRVVAEIDVPTAARSALVAISRPYFPGYRARVDSRRVEVNSYRSLMPLLELPGGTRGRLVLEYRPWWLTIGGALSASCAGILIASALLAWFIRRRDQYTSRL